MSMEKQKKEGLVGIAIISFNYFNLMALTNITAKCIQLNATMVHCLMVFLQCAFLTMQMVYMILFQVNFIQYNYDTIH